MSNTYIRDTRSMKAAPLAEEEEFRKAHPRGKFTYFDADTGIACLRPSTSPAVPDVEQVLDDADLDDEELAGE